MKTISFAVPCYNSAAYMDACIESILKCGDDIEIIIVDDGSTKDDTAAKADAWQERHPDLIRAIHKENGGHGSAVNTGLSHATGRYFKVVDSDDWLDEHAMSEIMAYLRRQAELPNPTDLVIGNYVYEKVHEGARTVMHYRNVFPEGREFGWADVGHFGQSQYLLMHSVIYRTELLRDMGLELPEHCFYVDNIFVYVPLLHRPRGPERERERDDGPHRPAAARDAPDDRRGEATRRRVRAAPRALHGELPVHDDVHLLHLPAHDRFRRGRGQARGHLGVPQGAQPRRLPPHPPQHAQHGTNLPTSFGRRIGITGYRVAQKIFKFN